MQSIDKSIAKIVSTRYKRWVDKVDAAGRVHNKNYNYYYDDVAMNLFKCQSGVCAYTEMYISPQVLYGHMNWVKGKYKIPVVSAYKRTDHFGELDHFDPNDKINRYWNWNNLFMIHSTINTRKSNTVVIDYLKPDLPAYSPEEYFNYDEDTHRFVPNTDIEDENIIAEIWHMIDNVLFLNHGVVKTYREEYINVIKDKQELGKPFKIDRFFTSVKWVLGLIP